MYFFCLSFCFLFAYLSLCCLTVSLSVCLPFFLSLSLLFVYLSVYLSVGSDLVIFCSQESELALRRQGSCVLIDLELPHLVRLEEDPLKTEIKLYRLMVSYVDYSPPNYPFRINGLSLKYFFGSFFLFFNFD